MKSLISIGVILCLWEIFAQGFIPSASNVFLTFLNLSTNIDFLLNILVSIERLSIGWSLGMLTGTFLGVLIAMNRLAADYTLPIISALFPIPKIALLPLFLVLFGLGESGKIATIYIGAFFPSIITAYSSVIRTPKIYIEAGRVFGGSKWHVTRKIVFPYSFPAIVQGFRTSLSLSMTLLVAAEMLGSQEGLGYWIFTTGGEMKFDQMFAGLIYLSLMGIIINHVIIYLRKTMFQWSIIDEGYTDLRVKT